MEYDVTIDRDLWIGGSDIPCIMGISPFKTRYELLLEKAGLRENTFKGNSFTVYGQILEPQIRDYINAMMPTGEKYEPNKVVDGDIRCHTDGFNGYSVLEIKTTSRIYKTIDEYKIYLVQLLLYMQKNNVRHGVLAVYKRAEDFSTDFTPDNLTIYNVDMDSYTALMTEINEEIERFRADLKRLRENPLLCEEDFQPDELVTLSNKLVTLEVRMSEFKELEKQYKEMKQALYEAMKKHDVKSWEMPNGTRITRVDAVAGTIQTVTGFDVDRFAAEQMKLFEEYQKTYEKKIAGRAGYVKITMP